MFGLRNVFVGVVIARAIFYSQAQKDRAVCAFFFLRGGSGEDAKARCVTLAVWSWMHQQIVYSLAWARVSGVPLCGQARETEEDAAGKASKTASPGIYGGTFLAARWLVDSAIGQLALSILRFRSIACFLNAVAMCISCIA